MSLPSNLVNQFAKLVKKEPPSKETTVYGTIVEVDGKRYVQFDGSNICTPVATTVGMTPGERVTVLIKNHTAIVTGNMTSPSARMLDVNDVEKTLTELAGNLGELGDSFEQITNNMGTSEEGMLLLGNAETPVVLVGSNIYHYATSSGVIYKPYYEAGDSVDIDWFGAGYISNDSKWIWFCIPLAKPIIGNVEPVITPKVDTMNVIDPSGASYTSAGGIIVRETGSYCYGSGYGSPVAPKNVTASISGDGGLVNVIASFDSTANASYQYAAGVEAHIRIDFVDASEQATE